MAGDVSPVAMFDDLTDVTLAIVEVMKVIYRRKLSSDESYLMMKVI